MSLTKERICATAAAGGLLMLAAAVTAICGGPAVIIAFCCLAGCGAVGLLAAWWLGLCKQFESLSGGSEKAARNVGSLVGSVNDSLADSRRQIDELNSQVQGLTIQSHLTTRQKRNTEEIIYSIRDAVLVTDGTERLLLANDAAGDLFGFDSRHSRMKLISELTDNGEFVNIVRQSRESRTRHAKHEIVVNKAGTSKTFACIVSCIHEDNGQVCGVVAVLHDITREKEISQMKNEFVSHVSHELKTPLASIPAYAEMLVDGEAADEETRAEFYSIIQAQAQRLNRLIEDILNISRIESGLIKINKSAASMTLLIRDAAQMIRSYAAEKNIKVTEQAAIVFDQVYVDKDMISQVLINLLSNAVKYTPSGGQVSVGMEVDEADGKVRITVTDTGVGIPVSEIDRVFDKFYRVEANNKCAKGTGLGLNLVKQIVEKVHDGRVFVSSKVGQGSTFGFELPLGMRQAVTKDN